MKKLILNNLGFKVSAVLLALLLWFFVTSRGQSEMSFEVTPEYKNVPAGLGIVNNHLKTVVVTIRGQERLMKNVRPSDVRVFVDLSRAKKGEGTYSIDRDDVQLPYAMAIINIAPTALRIRIDETLNKNVPVEPVLTGTPHKGHYVKAVKVEPSYVSIQGLKTELRKIAGIRTEPLDITGLRETTEQELNLEISGANIKPEVNTVKVIIEIAGRKQ